VHSGSGNIFDVVADISSAVTIAGDAKASAGIAYTKITEVNTNAQGVVNDITNSGVSSASVTAALTAANTALSEATAALTAANTAWSYAVSANSLVNTAYSNPTEANLVAAANAATNAKNYAAIAEVAARTAANAASAAQISAQTAATAHPGNTYLTSAVAKATAASVGATEAEVAAGDADNKFSATADYITGGTNCPDSPTARRTKEDRIKVTVNTGLTDGTLTCVGLPTAGSTPAIKTGSVKLVNGKRTITCKQDLSGNNIDFKRNVDITLDFNYQDSKSINVLVKHLS
jgi:hypothetical protein